MLRKSSVGRTWWRSLTVASAMLAFWLCADVSAQGGAGEANADRAPLHLPSTPLPASATQATNAGGATVTGSSTVTPASTLITAPEAPGSAPNGHMPNGAKASEVNGHRTIAESLGGLVINQVMTLAGQDFYSWFSQAWRDLVLTERYIIVIRERPSARWGSLIWVEFDNRRVYESFLPPRRAALQPIAERAAALTYDNVVQADIARLLFRDADLAQDEL